MACKMLKKIDISPGFVAFVCAYYYFDPMESFSVFMFSALLHELGHICCLSLLRQPIHSIKLSLNGANIKTGPLSYLHELLVAGSGPAVNFCLLCIFRRTHPLMAFLNFCLLLYNLLPIYPLDGGRITKALANLLLPQQIADAVVKLISGLCLVTIITFCIYLTCCWHAGLWPCLLSGLLLLRLGEMFFQEKQKFAHL